MTKPLLLLMIFTGYLLPGCGQGIFIYEDQQQPMMPTSPAVLQVVGYSFSTSATNTFSGASPGTYTVLSSNATVIHAITSGAGHDFDDLSAPSTDYALLDVVFGVPPGINPGQYRTMGIESNITAGTIPGTGSCNTGPASGGAGFQAAVLSNTTGYFSVFTSTGGFSNYNQNVVVSISPATAVLPATGAINGNVIVVSYYANSIGIAPTQCSILTVYNVQLVLNP